MAYRRPEPSRLTYLSKSLSWLLRHNVEKEGFKLLPGGFLYVDEVLRHSRFKNFTVEDVRKVVDTNDKQRFAVEEDTEARRLKIRANQGHSVQVEGLELQPIESAADIPVVVHGTTLANWHHIRSEGLRRMRRNHIHFAPGEPGEDGVISGMRQSSQVLIFIDAEKALADGIQFMRSANNVILSPGDKQGTIAPQYFKTVLEGRTRRELTAGSKDTKEVEAKGGTADGAKGGTADGAKGGTAVGAKGGTADGAKGGTAVGAKGGTAVGAKGGTADGAKGGTAVGAKRGTASEPEEKKKPHHPIPGLPYTAEQLADEVEKHKKKKKKKKKKKNNNKETETTAAAAAAVVETE